MLAIELHNTLHAGGDDLDDAPAWLNALGDRLPDRPGAPPTAAELRALRTAVASAFGAVLAGEAPPAQALDALNRAAARSPRSPRVEWPGQATDYHGATRADVIVGALAADAIELLTGPRRDKIRACGAPGCILLFLKDHPRREWCSNACGNRARQARHYRRTRQA